MPLSDSSRLPQPAHILHRAGEWYLLCEFDIDPEEWQVGLRELVSVFLTEYPWLSP